MIYCSSALIILYKVVPTFSSVNKNRPSAWPLDERRGIDEYIYVKLFDILYKEVLQHGSNFYFSTLRK